MQAGFYFVLDIYIVLIAVSIYALSFIYFCTVKHFVTLWQNAFVNSYYPCYDNLLLSPAESVKAFSPLEHSVTIDADSNAWFYSFDNQKEEKEYSELFLFHSN